MREDAHAQKLTTRINIIQKLAADYGGEEILWKNKTGRAGYTFCLPPYSWEYSWFIH
jgi:hypothetical protein